MARNKYYTAEEDARLLSLISFNVERTFVDIAKMAVSCGAIIGRTVDGVAGRVSVLAKKNLPEPTQPEECQVAIPEPVYEVEEKDNKCRRINLALGTELYNFCRIVSRFHGQTMTAFINMILSDYAEKNKDIYVAIMALHKQLEK